MKKIDESSADKITYFMAPATIHDNRGERSASSSDARLEIPMLQLTLTNSALEIRQEVENRCQGY